MKLLISIGILVWFSINTQAQKVEWLKGMSGNSIDIESACSDSFGNYFVAGSFEGNEDIDGVLLTNGGLGTLFIAKIDQDGNAVWVKRENSNLSEANGIGTDSLGNLYVAVRHDGTFQIDTFNVGDGYSIPRDYFLIKINPQGQILWIKGFDIADNSEIDDLQIHEGSIYVHGMAEYPTSIQGFPIYGSEKYFLVKYDLNGNAKWVLNFFDFARFKVDSKGHLIFAAIFSDTVHLGNNILIPHGLENIYVAKADEKGNYLWTTQTVCSPGSGGSVMTDLAIDNNGNTYVTGYYGHHIYFDSITLPKTSSLFIAKCDSKGNWQWARVPARDGYAISTSIMVDKQNDIYLGGFFSDTLVFGELTLVPQKLLGQDSYDFFLLKINRHGRAVWGLTSDNASQSVLHKLSLASDGSIIATGTVGDMDLQGFHLHDDRAFTFKLSQDVISNFDAVRSKKVEVYPNPAANFVYLSSDLNSRLISCEGIDLSGNIFPLNFSKAEQSIYIGSLPNGVYLLKFITPTGVEEAKVIVERHQ